MSCSLTARDRCRCFPTCQAQRTVYGSRQVRVHHFSRFVPMVACRLAEGQSERAAVCRLARIRRANIRHRRALSRRGRTACSGICTIEHRVHAGAGGALRLVEGLLPGPNVEVRGASVPNSHGCPSGCCSSCEDAAPGNIPLPSVHLPCWLSRE